MDALDLDDNVETGTEVSVFAAPGASYLVGEQQWSVGEPGFATAIARAWRRQTHVSCLCKAARQPTGHSGSPAMYLARLGMGYIVKRMPGTGPQHDPACFSFEQAPSVGADPETTDPAYAAVVRDERTGIASLRMGFALSHVGSRGTARRSGAAKDDATVTQRPDRLSLDGLLRLLWHEAELDRWHPSFEGKRHWGLVRHLLLLAASGFTVQGRPLTERLFIPEPFVVEQREQIAQRRADIWAKWAPPRDRSGPRTLGLLIGELKAIEPMRFGARVIVRHMPDRCLVMGTALWRRFEGKHGELLMAWCTQPGQRIVMATTMGMTSNGTPLIDGLSLFPTQWNWLPLSSTAV